MLPKLPKVYPNDMNMLSFIFTLARNDTLLRIFLSQIQFIRDRPLMTEEQVRRELKKIESKPMKPLQ